AIPLSELQIPVPWLSMTYASLGYVLYEWNRLDECRENLRDAIKLSELLQNEILLASCYIYMARVEHSLGNHIQSIALLSRVENLTFGDLGGVVSSYIKSSRVLLDLMQGDLEVPGRWADEYNGTSHVCT